MIIVLLGAPGGGKGTQAERLSERLGLVHLSTGDLFRAAIAKGTDLGLRAKGYIDRGELVPDDVTIGMVAERLQAPDCAKGVILDGFPRTETQALALQRFLDTLHRSVDAVLNLEVSEAVLMERLTGRWICRKCGAVYHSVFKPEREHGVCDLDGGVLYQRIDDAPATQRHRIEVYQAQTAPLIDFYRCAGTLVEIDGEGSVEQVQARLLDAIQGVGRGAR
ncbi:MAG: adenylate kinase [Chloroflexi bacterium]|nr:adenylate kinase [Chloroflexota bacterium]